jgi:hypothetical protein
MRSVETRGLLRDFVSDAELQKLRVCGSEARCIIRLGVVFFSLSTVTVLPPIAN